MPNEEAGKVPTPTARIDKNIRELAGQPAVQLVVDRMENDLVEKQIPFEVDALSIDDNGYLVADVRLGIVVRVVIESFGDDRPEEHNPNDPLEVDEDQFIHNTKKD